MTIEKHNLADELPEFRDKIHQLKTTDHHFARLFEQYHALDHEVLRIERGAKVRSDVYLEGKKKQRLHLKDQLFQALQA